MAWLGKMPLAAICSSCLCRRLTSSSYVRSRTFHLHSKRNVHSSATLAAIGRLGVGMNYEEEEFMLAQERVRIMDSRNEIDRTNLLQLSTLYLQATEGDVHSKTLFRLSGNMDDQTALETRQSIQGVTRFRARGEYIRVATAIWEQSEDDGGRSYRRGTRDDARGIFCVRTEELDTTGSDAHIIGSGQTDSGEKCLHSEIDDGVQTIWFNHPLRDNAVNLDMLLEMPKLLAAAEDDPSVFATVLTGQGGNYCGPIDSSVLQEVVFNKYSNNQEWREALLDIRQAIENYVSAFITSGKPLIAAVNGSAVGMGATTLALCDLTYASSMATIHCPHQQLALTTDGCASYTFPRILGSATANDLLLRGARHLVQDVGAKGLFSYVVDETRTSRTLQRVLYALSCKHMQAVVESRHLMRSYERSMLLAVNKGECDTMLERWQTADCQYAIQRYLAGKNVPLLPSSKPKVDSETNPFAIRGTLVGEKKDNLKSLPATEEDCIPESVSRDGT